MWDTAGGGHQGVIERKKDREGLLYNFLSVPVYEAAHVMAKIGLVHSEGQIDPNQMLICNLQSTP